MKPTTVIEGPLPHYGMISPDGDQPRVVKAPSIRMRKLWRIVLRVLLGVLIFGFAIFAHAMLFSLKPKQQRTWCFEETGKCYSDDLRRLDASRSGVRP